MKRIFGLLVILLIGISQSVAQTAYIEKCWVDYDVYNNGNKGMQIHIKFNVRGLKNRNIWVAASFYDEKSKNPIKCYADGYHNSSGMLVYQYFTPPYEYSVYDDFKLFMPYYVFVNSSMQPGKYTYFASIGIEGGEQIRTSNWYAFTYTRGSNPNPNPNSNRFANGRATGETWTKKTNDFEDVYTQQSDGTVKDVFYNKCISCFGTGTCQYCYGKGGHGGYWIAGRYIYTQCTACLGKCICSACNGTKKTILRTDILYPVQNFPQLANNPAYSKRNDGYYEKRTDYVPISNNHTNNDNISNDITGSNINNHDASPELCAQYIRHYQICEHSLEDMKWSPFYSYDDNRRRELQSEMRRIRSEAASRGCPSIAKSTWEDWDGTR